MYAHRTLYNTTWCKFNCLISFAAKASFPPANGQENWPVIKHKLSNAQFLWLMRTTRRIFVYQKWTVFLSHPHCSRSKMSPNGVCSRRRSRLMTKANHTADDFNDTVDAKRNHQMYVRTTLYEQFKRARTHTHSHRSVHVFDHFIPHPRSGN